MTTGAKIGFTLLGLVIIAIPVTILIVRKKSNKAVAPLSSTVEAPPPCVPFSKADQNRQRKKMNEHCAQLQFLPFVGPAKAYNCYKDLESNLTPITNC